MIGNMILIGFVSAVLGFILSVLVNKYKAQGSNEKLRELEKEYKDYRQQVDAHFINTGVLFKGTLCSEEAKALQVKMDEPTLLTMGLEIKPVDGEKQESVSESVTQDPIIDKVPDGDASASSVDENDMATLSAREAFVNEVELPTDIAEEIQVQSLNKK